MNACENFLAEEKDLKEKIKKLENLLLNEKLCRRSDVTKLELKVMEWEDKYRFDVDTVKE